MSNGKFFSGLTDTMMKHGPKPDRQRTNFFWPDDSNAKSVVEEKRDARRSSIKSPERELYISHNASLEVASPKNLHAKQQSSKIEFYDEVETPIRSKINNKNIKASVEKNVNNSRSSHKNEIKQKSQNSNVEFYDYKNIDVPSPKNVNIDVESTIRKNLSKSFDNLPKLNNNQDLIELEHKIKNAKIKSEKDSNHKIKNKTDMNYNVESINEEINDNSYSRQTHKESQRQNKNNEKIHEEKTESIKIVNGQRNSDYNEDRQFTRNLKSKKTNINNQHNENETSYTKRQTDTVTLEDDVPDKSNKVTKFHQIHFEKDTDDGSYDGVVTQNESRRRYESMDMPSKQTPTQSNKFKSMSHMPFRDHDNLEVKKHETFNEQLDYPNERTIKTHYETHTSSSSTSGRRSPNTQESQRYSYQNHSNYGVVGTPSPVPEARVRAHSNLKSNIFFG